MGRPNAGKSTLLNSLLGEEISIVTPLPQTTRQVLRGILTRPEGQIAFVDTPGMHRGKHAINKAMAKAVEDTLEPDHIDAILYIVDLSRDFGEEESLIAGLVAPQKKRALILFNKADLCSEPGKRIAGFFRSYPPLGDTEYRIVTATKLEKKDEILAWVFSILPQGEPHFPEEYATDTHMRFLAAEIIRRQVILNTHDEVPHAACVLVNSWNEEEGAIRIQADVVVETQSQKGILIGEGARRVRQIRQFSRKEIAKMAGAKIEVELFVKVRPKWRDNPGFLRQLGIDPMKAKKGPAPSRHKGEGNHER